MKTIHFAVIGADKRLSSAAEFLRGAGIQVSLWGEKDFALEAADAVLLPLPLSRDGVHISNTNDITVSEVLGAAGNVPIFAGLTGAFSDRRLIDYTKEDLFAILNAVPTAEGTLAIVLSETETTVRGMRVGITGFGKVASATAALFSAAGAKITIFARRKEARAEAEALGHEASPIDTLKEQASAWDTLINTVPAKLITADILQNMRRDALIVDLASAPGGVDFSFAKELSIRAIHALALPGKYSPKTAGEAIAKTVLALFSESNGEIISHTIKQ